MSKQVKLPRISTTRGKGYLAEVVTLSDPNNVYSPLVTLESKRFKDAKKAETWVEARAYS